MRVDEPSEVRDDLAPDRILLAHFAFVEADLVQLGQGAGHGRPAFEYWASRAGRVGHRAELASGGGRERRAQGDRRAHWAVSSRPRSSVNCGVQRSMRRIFSMLTTRRRMLSMSRRSTCWMSIAVPRAVADRGGELIDRRLDPGADVEDLALGARVDGGQQGRVDRVVDVGVVARLLPVAVDGDGPAGMGLDEELRDDAAVGVVRPLVRAVDVREADRRDAQAVALGEGRAVVLAAQLADRVGGQRPQPVVLVDRDRPRVAVHRRRRRVDDAVDLGFARRQEDVERAPDVRRVVVERVGGRGDDVPRGQVEDQAVLGDELLDQRRRR